MTLCPSDLPSLGGASDKDPTCQCRRLRDSSSIPGSGKPPEGGHGNPLQYSCLENPHGQRILVGYSALGSQRIRHDWSNLALIIRVTLRDYHNLPSLLKSNFLDCSSNGLISLSSTLPFFPFTKKKPLFKSILLKWTEYEGFKWNQSLPLCIISQTTDPSNSLAPQLLPS